MEGWGQLEIARWLNTTGYTVRKKGKKPQSYKWDKDNVSKLLRDTAYTGVLKYGKTFVDLTEFYDFEAVISVDDFLKVNKVKDLADPKLVSAVTVKPRDSTKADMLRSMIICGYCDKPCASGISTKRDKETKKINEARYYYRCETDGCVRKNKSIRAKVVVDYAANFLDEHLFTTEANYEEYVTEAQEYANVQAHSLDSDIAALTRQIGNKRTEYERTKQTVRDNPQYARHYNLDEIEAELKAIETDQTKLINTRKRLKKAILTYSEYLELFEAIGVKLRKTHDMQVVDETVRKFFLNFTIKDRGAGQKQRYEIAHNLKKPWAEFVETDNFVRGRELPTGLELYNFITSEADYFTDMCKELEAIRAYEPTDTALVVL